MSYEGVTVLEESKALKNSAIHNSGYRGRYISYIGTEEICTRIYAGTFENLHIGDYFDVDITTKYGTETVRNILAGFNLYYNELGKNHAVVIPRNCFKTPAYMNNTVSTEGGYANSKMNTEILPMYANALNTAFNNHLIPHKALLSTKVNAMAENEKRECEYGVATHSDYTDNVYLELMPESAFGLDFYGNRYDDGNILKLNLFNFDNGLNDVDFKGTKGFWLRSVASDTSYVYVNDDLMISKDVATAKHGILPFYFIG